MIEAVATSPETESPCVAAVVQLTAKQDLQLNLEKGASFVRQAVARGANFVVLPENFTYIGELAHKVRIAEDLERPGPILTTMMAVAREQRVHLLLGGIPTQTVEQNRCCNTSVLIGPSGTLIAHYHKIHLFDVNIPDGVVFRESEFVRPGSEPMAVPLPFANVGLSICYDLRFPELYRRLAKMGANVLAVPAAFSLHTGKDHWIPLLRARAIENACYVLAAGQYGKHTETRFTYGKSAIIDPWGTVLAQVSDGEGVAVAPLDMAFLRKVRRELPALDHRRLTV